MKTKLAVVLALVLIFTLSVGLMGCKVTGGGFLQESEERVNFGFNVQLTEAGVTGQFQLVVHDEKPPTRIHGTFDGVLYIPFVGYVAGGLCTINGEGSYPFTLYADDNGEPGIGGDYICLVIPGDGRHYEGTIAGGNIQVHEDGD